MGKKQGELFATGATPKKTARRLKYISKKDVIKKLLLPGNWMALSKSLSGTQVYRMYDAKRNPIGVVLYRSLRSWRNNDFIREDKPGHFILSLKSIRALHGNNWVKKQYKKARPQKNLSATGAGFSEKSPLFQK